MYIYFTRIESVSFPNAKLTSKIFTIKALNTTVNKKYTIYFTRFLTIIPTLVVLKLGQPPICCGALINDRLGRETIWKMLPNG